MICWRFQPQLYKHVIQTFVQMRWRVTVFCILCRNWYHFPVLYRTLQKFSLSLIYIFLLFLTINKNAFYQTQQRSFQYQMHKVVKNCKTQLQCIHTAYQCAVVLTKSNLRIHDIPLKRKTLKFNLVILFLQNINFPIIICA